jgi:hypothetical protein
MRPPSRRLPDNSIQRRWSISRLFARMRGNGDRLRLRHGGRSRKRQKQDE